MFNKKPKDKSTPKVGIENLEVTEEQAKIGVSIIDGKRCLHGLNSDQVDDMNMLGLGLDEYKKLRNIKH